MRVPVPEIKNYKTYLFKNDDESSKIINCKPSYEIEVLEGFALRANPKPKKLYLAGEINKKDRIRLAVVGARNISGYGIDVCKKFIPELVSAGITIVSGLMYGVDKLSHEIALKYGGRTIAVLGYGYNHIKNHSYSHGVVRDILEGNGAIISEYEPDKHGEKFTFVKRNRIVAGLADGVLIIDAAKNSGSLITSGMAADLGKDVYIIPGSIFSPLSEGKHGEIKKGAYLVDDPIDILDAFNLQGDKLVRNMSSSGLSEVEKEVFDILKMEAYPVATEEIAIRLDKPIRDINIVLSALEINGVIEKNPVGSWKVRIL